MKGQTSICRWLAFGFACLLLSIFFLAFARARQNGRNILIEATTSVKDNPAACATSGCHSSFAVNSLGSVGFTGLPEDGFEPGQTYDLGIEINNDAQVYGFQLVTIYADSKNQAGELTAVTNGVARVFFQGVDHLTHSPSPLQNPTISFQWAAPADPEGPVIFRVASNSANNDSRSTGDRINWAEVTIEPAQDEEPPPEQITFFLAQIADALVEASALAFSTEFDFNNTGPDTPLKIEFFDSGGNPLELTLGDLGTASVFDLELARGETLSLETPATEEGVRFGYARITTAAGVGTTAVFRRFHLTPSGRILLTEAGVPASTSGTDFSLLLDSLGAKDTGVALVNSGDSTAGIIVRLYDQDFQLLGTSTIQLQPGEHLASFVWEIFRDAGLNEVAAQAQEMKGAATFQSDQPLDGVTLRQNDAGLGFPAEVPTLTTFPLTPGRADQE
ncbi:MAG: choice-of-anchor V domain-containing protein [Acidobacteriota bacterium]